MKKAIALNAVENKYAAFISNDVFKVTAINSDDLNNLIQSGVENKYLLNLEISKNDSIYIKDRLYFSTNNFSIINAFIPSLGLKISQPIQLVLKHNSINEYSINYNLKPAVNTFEQIVTLRLKTQLIYNGQSPNKNIYEFKDKYLKQIYLNYYDAKNSLNIEGQNNFSGKVNIFENGFRSFLAEGKFGKHIFYIGENNVRYFYSSYNFGDLNVDKYKKLSNADFYSDNFKKVSIEY